MDKPKPKFRPLNILTKPPIKKGEKPTTAVAAKGLADIGNSIGGVASMIGQFGALAQNEDLANAGMIASNIATLGGDIAGKFAKKGVNKSTPKLRNGAKGMKC